jgi:hypothetical protein
MIAILNGVKENFILHKFKERKFRKPLLAYLTKEELNKIFNKT